MKQFISALCLALALFSASPILAADNVTTTVKVNGMVCDFCAQALEAVFKKQETVQDIRVDLDAGEVVIHSTVALDDQLVTKLIQDSGYDVVEIVH